MTALIPVRVAECGCPDTPHDGHHVLMAPTISLTGAIEAEKAMVEVGRNYPVPVDKAGKPTDLDALSDRSRALIYAWAPIFVRHGAKDWDFCDAHGEPIPFDIEAILADYSIARLISDKASDLGYGTAVMAPFQPPPEKPSPRGPTPATTSKRQTPIPTSPDTPSA